MDRRPGGVLLLVAALVAVLVIPNIGGKQVRGAAVTEVIAAPPAVGSCVSAITRVPAARGPMNRATADESVSVRELPVATVLPCRGTVIGEVISVKAVTSSKAVTLDEFDQANPSCRSQVEGYLGTTASTTIDGVRWSKSVYVNAVSVGPDAHDRAAGRTWTACVMTAVGQSYPVSASLRSSWMKGTLPGVFGLCWASDIVQKGAPTACASPHTTQQLGYGLIGAPTDTGTSIVSSPTPKAQIAGCEALAASVMMVSDPTRGGALAIQVVSDNAGLPYVQCAVSVVGPRKLTGSLIGIGTKALPLA